VRSVELYRAFEAAVFACGEVRVHPQRTRIAFISTMTFAGAKLALDWMDIMSITPEPIDDPRIRSIVCYGPTSFGDGLRIAAASDLDADIREWLCVAKRRGDEAPLDPDARVAPLTGRPLGLVHVPLRSRVIERSEARALRIPGYAADVFGVRPAVRVSVGGEQARGMVGASGTSGWVAFAGHELESLGLGVGDAVDVGLCADL
jgi:hypothetical protein